MKTFIAFTILWFFSAVCTCTLNAQPKQYSDPQVQLKQGTLEGD